MTNQQKAQRSLDEAIFLLRNKSPESTLVERYFLLYEAWDMVKDLPQPLQLGKGLYFVLSHASHPVKEYDLLLGRFDDHVPSAVEQQNLERLWQTDPNSCPIVSRNSGHLTPDWEMLIRLGLTGCRTQAETRLRKAETEGEGEKSCLFLRGMILIYESILLYIRQYGEAAEQAGLSDCAEVCRNLSESAPVTFREALQLILFVYLVYLIYAGRSVACLTTGRLDDILLPYYEHDLREGLLTEADAGALIDDFSAKMSLHLGRGEHQMAYLNPDYVQTGWLRNPVYESPGYIVIGGYSNTHDHRTNPLTFLFAEHIHPELKNPVYVVRRTAEDTDRLWDILCEKIRNNASLLLYNDETMIPAYTHIGAEKQDAVNYSIHPCNWADMGGGSAIVGHCGIPLPMLIQNVLDSGVPFGSMEDLYSAIHDAYREMIRPVFKGYRSHYRTGNILSDGQLSLDDCFMPGPMEAAGNLYCGGAKYPALYMLLRSIGTAADMLSAADTLVFRDKYCTLPQLAEAARTDFENDPQLLRACRKAPKYGTDNDLADGHARRLMNDLLDIIDEEAIGPGGKRDIHTLNVTINDSNHLRDGAAMPATIDGRRKGKPLSENLSPTVGCAPDITSLLNSAAKLPFSRIHSGALNLRLGKYLLTEEQGPARLKALIQTYFTQGGMQLQISIADTKELRAAQEFPEDHRDLLVRITGYSAIFVDMAKGAQEEFIRREELR